ncbi:MAG: HlyD family efflux transporter periplasmic adaptor subunit [Pseudomonadota bacterium]
MRFLRQSLIGIFLAALTFGLLAYAAQMVIGAIQERMAESSRVPPQRERVFVVNVVMAEIGTHTPYLEAFGEVKSRRTLEVRSAASGWVTELSEVFEDGGSVKRGQVLMRIDPTDAQAALARAEADLLDAQAELRDAERLIVLAHDEEAAAREQSVLRDRAYERQKDLETRGVGTAAAVESAELSASSARQAVLASRQSVAQAEARIDQAKTTLTRAEIALEEAERMLDDTTLVAPFDGTLSDASMVEGRLVTQNEKLAELIDPDALEVSFRVSTAQYARLLDSDGALRRAELEATLVVSGIDLTTTGQITRASAATGDGQTGRLVFATLDRAVGFKPGDFVNVRVQEQPIDTVVRLPSSAYDPAGAVLVLGEGDRLERLTATLVRRQGDVVLVSGPDLEGREIVQSRSPLLGPGILVRPVRRGAVPEQAGPEMVELSDERRARLVAFVEGNSRMPAEAKARVLARLNEPSVPVRMVQRIESQMGS